MHPARTCIAAWVVTAEQSRPGLSFLQHCSFPFISKPLACPWGAQVPPKHAVPHPTAGGTTLEQLGCGSVISDKTSPFTLRRPWAADSICPECCR